MMPAPLTLYRIWHATMIGSFIIAYGTADEDTYAMHLFSGYVLLGAIVVRLALMPLGGMWRAPRMALGPVRGWTVLALAATTIVSAVSGALADGRAWLEHPHEAVSQLALTLVFVHLAHVAWVHVGRKWIKSAAMGLVGLICLSLPAMAQQGPDAARRALIGQYAAQAGQPLTAARGETLFRTNHGGGDSRTPSCTSCHTPNPKQPGQNAKTGRPIDPVAVSVNAKRFTDPDLVEKQFARDCKSVLGRECSAQEKGDYLTFMSGQ